MARRPAVVMTTQYFESTTEQLCMYPEVIVDLGNLLGPEGNAFVVVGRTADALKKAGIDPDEYRESAMAGDYENLLRVTRTWVRVFETGPGRPQDQ